MADEPKAAANLLMSTITAAANLLSTITTAVDSPTPQKVDLARIAYTKMRKSGFDLTDFKLPSHAIESIRKMLKEVRMPPWGNGRHPLRTPEEVAMNKQLHENAWKDTANNSVALVTAYANAEEDDPYHLVKWMSATCVGCHVPFDELGNERMRAAKRAYDKFLEAGETLEEYYDTQTCADMLQALKQFSPK